MNFNQNSNMCLIAKENDPWIWHKRFCHINFKTIDKLAKNDLVRGLPNLSFKVDNLCDACQIGKLTKSSFSKR